MQDSIQNFWLRYLWSFDQHSQWANPDSGPIAANGKTSIYENEDLRLQAVICTLQSSNF